MKLIWIALGGGLGAVLRYLLGGALGARTEALVPWGTVAVNVAGCFLIGLASAWFLAQDPEREGLRLALVVGLLGARSYFGFITLLGIVSLSGVVINNAIVLIDRIGIEIDELGRTPAQAIIEAATRRLRPILLTTGTTVLGLIPLWIGGGSMFRPMAITIIFGLLFATVLTLGLVPVLYSLLFRVDIREYGPPSIAENRHAPPSNTQGAGAGS